METPQLLLHEELMLMALRDEKGTVEWRASMSNYAIGGAILAELLLDGLVKIGSDKKKLVSLAKRKPLSDPLLEESLELIASAKRRRKAADWVNRFASIRRLRRKVIQELCRKGILRESEDKVLLIFRRKIYPTIDPIPEHRLKERLRRAITGATLKPQPRTAILLSLAHGTSMLPIYFDKHLLRLNKQRIKRIASGELIGGAAKEAVEAAQMAIAMAGAAATVQAAETAGM